MAWPVIEFDVFFLGWGWLYSFYLKIGKNYADRFWKIVGSVCCNDKTIKLDSKAKGSEQSVPQIQFM